MLPVCVPVIGWSLGPSREVWDHRSDHATPAIAKAAIDAGVSRRKSACRRIRWPQRREPECRFGAQQGSNEQMIRQPRLEGLGDRA